MYFNAYANLFYSNIYGLRTFAVSSLSGALRSLEGVIIGKECDATFNKIRKLMFNFSF